MNAREGGPSETRPACALHLSDAYRVSCRASEASRNGRLESRFKIGNNPPMDHLRRFRVAVPFDTILEAFEFVSFGPPEEHHAYLCLETGRIYWHSELGADEEELPEDIDDAEKYVAIPHKNDLDLRKESCTRLRRRSSCRTLRATWRGCFRAVARMPTSRTFSSAADCWSDGTNTRPQRTRKPCATGAPIRVFKSTTL